MSETAVEPRPEGPAPRQRNRRRLAIGVAAGVALLLYARKEAVKVEIEMLNGLWLAHGFRRFGKGEQ